jgi:hypothetical protein
MFGGNRMIIASSRKWIGTAYPMVLALCIVFTFLSFGYGLSTGFIEARGAPRFIPAAAIDGYCWPARLINRVPLLRVWVALANHSAYELAGGPETTR